MDSAESLLSSLVVVRVHHGVPNSGRQNRIAQWRSSNFKLAMQQRSVENVLRFTNRWVMALKIRAQGNLLTRLCHHKWLRTSNYTPSEGFGLVSSKHDREVRLFYGVPENNWREWGVVFCTNLSYRLGGVRFPHSLPTRRPMERLWAYEARLRWFDSTSAYQIQRKCAREAYGRCLESRWSRKGHAGSNPVTSAKHNTLTD